MRPSRAYLGFAAIAMSGVLASSAFAGTMDCTPIGTTCNDTTTSLGKFIIAIAPPFQAALVGNPNYNATSHLFTSPLLFDPATIIGRSLPFMDGLGGDIGPALIGAAGGAVPPILRIGDPALVPAGFPTGNREIHTAVLDLNLVGGGFAVRAGASAQGAPNSLGEVEAIGGTDFPAKSFFDIFVDVDIPGLGTVANTAALLVQADLPDSANPLPPKVIYVHGVTSQVPVIIQGTGPFAGDTLGNLILAGHGIGYTLADQNLFNQQFDAIVAEQLPEPGTVALLFGGLAAMGWHGLRRRTRS
jgi:hypothetical protein